jgi:hypothetical protein
MADSTLPVLKRTLELIQERGWTVHYSAYSQANGGPLNLRMAITKAVDEVADGSREAQISALQCLTMQLEGIHSAWEAGTTSGSRPRTHDEVVEKLSDIINRLEHDAPEGFDGLRTHRADFGKRPAGKCDPGAGPAAV